nr:MAG TPA: hypothetical protein [Caudoviricetes sp.]
MRPLETIPSRLRSKLVISLVLKPLILLPELILFKIT